MIITTDDHTLTYLLGYLTAEQWADALEFNRVSEELIYSLMEEQDKLYSGGMKERVKELIKEAVVKRLTK